MAFEVGSVPPSVIAAQPASFDVTQNSVNPASTTATTLLGDAPAAPPASDDPNAAKKPTAKELQEKALAEVNQRWDEIDKRYDTLTGATTVDNVPTEVKPSVDAGKQEPVDDAAAKTAGLASLADLYGLDVKQLERFSSVTEAEKALADADAENLFGGNQQLPPAQPPATPATPPAPAASPAAGQDEMDWTGIDDDNPIRVNFERMRKEAADNKQKLDALVEITQRQVTQSIERETTQRVHSFHQQLDTLNTERFGKSGSLTSTQLAARNLLAQRVEQAADNLVARGASLDAIKADFLPLVDRVDRVVFRGEIENERRKTREQTTAKTPRPQLGAPGRAQPRDVSAKEQLGDYKHVALEHNPVVHAAMDAVDAKYAGTS